MQPKQFNRLALAAVISLIAAGVVHSAYNHFEDEDTVSGKRLFPALETGGDATGLIAIQAGEKALSLKKSADGKVWSIVERAGYPVSAPKVRELVLKLGQAELIEKKTRNPELYGQLDLGDPKAKDASSKLVRLADKDNKTIAEVVIGKERRAAFGAGKSGTYVRLPGDPQTWLAKLELNASTALVDWVDPVFFRVDEKKIDKITVRKGAEVIYTLGRAAKKGDEKKGAFALVDVPAGKTQNSKLRIDDLVNGIRTLEMTEVREARIDDAKPEMTTEIEMEDGAKYLVNLKRDGKKSWITVSVGAEGRDAAEAKKLGEATKGWAFEIADWRVNQTFKTADEIYEAAAVAKPAVAKPAVAKPAVAKPAAAKPAEAARESAPPEPANAAAPK